MTEYIYTITCPVSKMVIYVGKTINPELRKKQHFRNHTKKSCIGYWCKAMISINLIPVFNIEHRYPLERICNYSHLEQTTIKKYKDIGQAFFNYPSNKRNFKPFRFK